MKKDVDAERFFIGASLNRLYSLLELDYLQNSDNTKSPFYQSVATEFVIQLHYLLNTDDLKGIANEINFQIDSRHKTVVKLIEYYRHAICHSDDTGKRKNTRGQHVISFQFGLPNDDFSPIEHVCKFSDDIAFVIGQEALYIRRHLVKVFVDLSDRAYRLPAFSHFLQLLQLRNARPIKM